MNHEDFKNICAKMEIEVAKNIQDAGRELIRRKYLDSPEALEWVTDAIDAAVKAAMNAIEKTMEG